MRMLLQFQGVNHARDLMNFWSTWTEKTHRHAKEDKWLVQIWLTKANMRALDYYYIDQLIIHKLKLHGTSGANTEYGTQPWKGGNNWQKLRSIYFKEHECVKWTGWLLDYFCFYLLPQHFTQLLQDGCCFLNCNRYLDVLMPSAIVDNNKQQETGFKLG